MEQHNIHVTGGLGFIGSHTIVCSHEAGYMPVIIDNLNNSRIEVLLAIKKLIQYTPEFIQGYVNEKSVMTEVFRNICPRQLYIFRHIRPLGKVESNH